MYIRRLVKSCLSSLPVIKMGFGKMPTVSKLHGYPLWEILLMRPLKYPGWKQLAMTPQTIPKRNKHTDKGDARQGFGYRQRSVQPTYNINQEKVNEHKHSQRAEKSMDDHQHHYTQKHQWKNLKEKIQQKAPLWSPKHHLKKEGFALEDKPMKRKVAEVYLKKNAESFPLRKSEPFPKD